MSITTSSANLPKADLYHPLSTGRLYAFGIYGPLTDSSSYEVARRASMFWGGGN